jgi:peptidoglycan/xylan/chitin deacetylase (PgdA/CDA1 family)
MSVIVLCYHAVSETWPAALSVRPERLEAQLAFLLRRGYRGVTFYDAVTAPENRTLAVTFDDAFRSVIEQAFPILERAGIPGTVFVPTRFPDEGRRLGWPGVEHWAATPHAHELAGLSWEELGTLARAGWEIGSHTCTHPRLTQLDDATLDAELAESRAACERGTGTTCRSIAYPYGDVDDRVVGAARTAGYTAGAALPSRPGPHAPLAWPRIGVWHTDRIWRFGLKTSAVVTRLRGTSTAPASA